jgi:hypothetical protein
VNAPGSVLGCSTRIRPCRTIIIEGDWSWVKGALSTIDRPYGVFDFFHTIGSTHVWHAPLVFTKPNILMPKSRLSISRRVFWNPRDCTIMIKHRGTRPCGALRTWYVETL